jgi:hypothetical protein
MSDSDLALKLDQLQNHVDSLTNSNFRQTKNSKNSNFENVNSPNKRGRFNKNDNSDLEDTPPLEIVTRQPECITGTMRPFQVELFTRFECSLKFRVVV